MLEEFRLEAGATKGRVCGWRSAVFCLELLEIEMGMWFGMTSRLHTVIVLLM
jgi:hypothetical protein